MRFKSPNKRATPPTDPLILRLYEHRMKRGVALDDLAVVLGYTRVTIAAWEMGKHKAPPFTRSVIATYLEAQE